MVSQTGLYYYGARYYSAWLGRFVGVDPLQFKFPHFSPFAYGNDNPVRYTDPSGMQSEDEIDQLQRGSFQLDTSGMRSEINRIGGDLRKMESKSFNGFSNKMHNIENKEEQLRSWHPPMKDYTDPNDIIEGFEGVIMMDEIFELSNTSQKTTISLNNKVSFSPYQKTDEGGCKRRCDEMLSSAGYKAVARNDKRIVQMTKENKDGMLTVMPESLKGIEMIDKHLEKGKPILVGVDYKSDYKGDVDNTTDY